MRKLVIIGKGGYLKDLQYHLECRDKEQGLLKSLAPAV